MSWGQLLATTWGRHFERQTLCINSPKYTFLHSTLISAILNWVCLGIEQSLCRHMCIYNPWINPQAFKESIALGITFVFLMVAGKRKINSNSPSLLLVSVIKHCPNTCWQRKAWSWTQGYRPSWRETIERTQDRDQGQEKKQRAEGALPTGRIFMVCPAYFLIQSKTTFPGLISATVVWALSNQYYIN